MRGCEVKHSTIRTGRVSVRARLAPSGEPGGDVGNDWPVKVPGKEGTMSAQYEVLKSDGKLVKAWTRGVPLEEAARRQVENVARLPFIYKHVAVMPDVHFGRGATVGSVIPTKGAII